METILHIVQQYKSISYTEQITLNLANIDFYLYNFRVIGSLLINKSTEDNREELDKIVENCNFALMRDFRHDYNEHHDLDIIINVFIALASSKQYKMYSNDQNIDKINDYATQYYNVVTTLLQSQNQNEKDDLFIVLISSLMFTDYYEQVEKILNYDVFGQQTAGYLRNALYIIICKNCAGIFDYSLGLKLIQELHASLIQPVSWDKFAEIATWLDKTMQESYLYLLEYSVP